MNRYEYGVWLSVCGVIVASFAGSALVALGLISFLGVVVGLIVMGTVGVAMFTIGDWLSYTTWWFTGKRRREKKQKIGQALQEKP